MIIIIDSKVPLDADQLGKRLWGDIYYDEESKRFVKNPSETATSRSFVYFIMEPLYKLISHTISCENLELKGILAKVGLHMKKSVLKLDIKPLLRSVCKAFFQESTAFAEMCIQKIPNPIDNARNKVIVIIVRL